MKHIGYPLPSQTVQHSVYPEVWQCFPPLLLLRAALRTDAVCEEASVTLWVPHHSRGGQTGEEGGWPPCPSTHPACSCTWRRGWVCWGRGRNPYKATRGGLRAHLWASSPPLSRLCPPPGHSSSSRPSSLPPRSSSTGTVSSPCPPPPAPPSSSSCPPRPQMPRPARKKCCDNSRYASIGTSDGLRSCP